MPLLCAVRQRKRRARLRPLRRRSPRGTPIDGRCQRPGSGAGMASPSSAASRREPSPAMMSDQPSKMRSIPTNVPITQTADTGHSAAMITPSATVAVPPATAQAPREPERECRGDAKNPADDEERRRREIHVVELVRRQERPEDIDLLRAVERVRADGASRGERAGAQCRRRRRERRAQHRCVEQRTPAPDHVRSVQRPCHRGPWTERARGRRALSPRAGDSAACRNPGSVAPQSRAETAGRRHWAAGPAVAQCGIHGRTSADGTPGRSRGGSPPRRDASPRAACGKAAADRCGRCS